MHTYVHTQTYVTHIESSLLRTLWDLNLMSLLQRFQVKSTCTLSYTYLIYICTAYTYTLHTQMHMYINLYVLRPSKISSFHRKGIKVNKININSTLSPAPRSPPQKRKPSLACILQTIDTYVAPNGVQ